MRARIGRVSGLVAVLFGLLVGYNMLTAPGIDGWEWLLIGGSAALSLGGGTAYLVALERRARRLRLVAWAAYSVGLLLPTSLFILQYLAILGGLAPPWPTDD